MPFVNSIPTTAAATATATAAATTVGVGGIVILVCCCVWMWALYACQRWAVKYLAPIQENKSSNVVTAMAPLINSNSQMRLDHRNEVDLISLAFVPDYFRYRVVVFNVQTSTSVRFIGVNKNNLGYLGYPSSCVLLRAAEKILLFVSEFTKDQISVFDAETGEYLRRFGSRGSENGQFCCPEMLAISSESDESPMLFVADTSNRRIQVHDATTGDYIRTIGTGTNGLSNISGLAFVAETDWLLVCDRAACKIYVFDATTGQFVKIFKNDISVHSLAVYSSADLAETRVYVASFDCVKVFGLLTGDHLMDIGGEGSSRRQQNVVGISLQYPVDPAMHPLVITATTVGHSIAAYDAITGEYVKMVDQETCLCPKYLSCLTPDNSAHSYLLK